MKNLEQYKQMHSAGHFPGHSTRKWSDRIKALIEKHGAKTILDFGSGKGMQYDEQQLHKAWGVEKPRLYDPAVPGIDVMPNPMRPFDGVICCDVLEHLEGKEIMDAIWNVVIRADKFAFFSISTKKAKKNLPDGRNAHLTIQSSDWWLGMFDALPVIIPKGLCQIEVVFDGD